MYTYLWSSTELFHFSCYSVKLEKGQVMLWALQESAWVWRKSSLQGKKERCLNNHRTMLWVLCMVLYSHAGWFFCLCELMSRWLFCPVNLSCMFGYYQWTRTLKLSGWLFSQSWNLIIICTFFTLIFYQIYVRHVQFGEGEWPLVKGPWDPGRGRPERPKRARTRPEWTSRLFF